MVAVTARMAAGLQVEAQASLDSRKHDNERQTNRKFGQGRTPIAREVRAACVVALQEDDAALSKAGIHTALGRTMARLAHAQESAGSSGGQDGVQHVAARSQRSAEQNASTAGPPESARMCRPEVFMAHLRKAWICRAMRLACLHRTQPW